MTQQILNRKQDQADQNRELNLAMEKSRLEYHNQGIRRQQNLQKAEEDFISKQENLKLTTEQKQAMAMERAQKILDEKVQKS